MSATSFFSYINSQPTPGSYPTWSRPDAVRRAVTISRQAGCGAQEIAGKLAARLQAHGSHTGCPWTIFDKTLLERVQTDPRLPKYIAAYLPDDRKPVMDEILDNLFTRHPPREPAIRQSAETILGLAEVGNVILVGCGAHVVTAQVPHVLHVRMVAPLEQRLRRAYEIYGKSPIEARDFCVRDDLEHGQYLQTHFNADVNDPLAYHLVINTGLMSYDAAAKLIEEALLTLGTMPKSGEFWVDDDHTQTLKTATLTT